MNINATLVVQVFNFFVAYLLFRFILLKPAYAAIKGDEKTQSSLELLIAEDKRIIEIRQQEVIDQWRKSSLFFQKYLPQPINKVALFKGIRPKIKPMALEKEKIKRVKNQVARAIVNAMGVENDYS